MKSIVGDIQCGLISLIVKHTTSVKSKAYAFNVVQLLMVMHVVSVAGLKAQSRREKAIGER
jgi:hypothetical protein